MPVVNVSFWIGVVPRWVRLSAVSVRRISCLLSFSRSQLIIIKVFILLLFRALRMMAASVHWETSLGLT